MDGSRHVVDERLRWWMRVLVGVESHRNVQLRCAVGRFAAQILTQWQVGQGYLTSRRPCFLFFAQAAHHFSNLRRTASPCAGRFSASASVITYPDASLSAASS